MRKRLTFIIVGLFVGLAFLVSPTAAHAVVDKDCGDFDNRRQAQNFFLGHGGPQNDPHRLDSDGDGKACEDLPCPCPGSGGGGGGGTSTPVKRQKAKVIKVTDGDTVRVNLIPGPKKDVRLIGIDTPEVYGGVECGGPAASRSAKRMLPRGTRVLLLSDPSQDLKDRYGRLLRYVHKGKTDVNLKQVVRGHARVYVYNSNPFKRVKSYRGAQRTAKRLDRGMWGHC